MICLSKVVYKFQGWTPLIKNWQTEFRVSLNISPNGIVILACKFGL
jgi:hypothetical protein